MCILVISIAAAHGGRGLKPTSPLFKKQGGPAPLCWYRITVGSISLLLDHWQTGTSCKSTSCECRQPRREYQRLLGSFSDLRIHFRSGARLTMHVQAQGTFERSLHLYVHECNMSYVGREELKPPPSLHHCHYFVPVSPSPSFEKLLLHLIIIHD